MVLQPLDGQPVRAVRELAEDGEAGGGLRGGVYHQHLHRCAAQALRPWEGARLSRL